MTPLAVHVDNLENRTSTPYAFIKSPVRVGRGELNDLTIDAPYVSTWHGVIQFDDDGIRFVDLGSTNGTWLDGVRLERNVPAAILPESELRIGSLRLRLARRVLDERPAPRRNSTQFALRVTGANLAAQRESPDAAAERAGAGDAERPEAGPADSSASPAGGAEPAAPSGGPDPALEAIEGASWQLGVLHDSLRQAREDLETAITHALVPLSEPDRARARALVAQRFPSGGAEAPASASGAPPADDLLRAFAASYVTDPAVLDAPGAPQAFLEGLAEVLETSVKSYLELRRGYDEFGREMGVRVPQAEGGLARARDSRQLLAYLLLPSAGESRARELGSAFADLMIHQVALLNGVTGGAKDLLEQLSPEAVSRDLEREAGAGKLTLGVKALREGAQWRAYVARHRALAEEESALSEVLFGKAFARAYAAVAGRRGGASGDEDSTPAPATGRRGDD